MKPIIGITVEIRHDEKDDLTGGRLVCNKNYTDLVTWAGGVPLLIPPTADMNEVSHLIDGWLIPGGNDIDAHHFGQQNHAKVLLGDDERFLSERLLFEAIPPELPVLGICYGCQFLNVVQGGDLIQHLPDVSSDSHEGGPLQTYSLKPGSLLSRLTSAKEIIGRSYHHQASGRVAEGLSVVAKAGDGTIEALESTERPWLMGVQWHPERTSNDAATQDLFRGFIRAATDYQRTREDRRNLSAHRVSV